ncbi:hypothetical protein EYR36_006899 [Pleurotus pulmonarius]|nr:hypothetical protein EYR36_006899 [Pleurotus pulmonarius]KAF4580327.1 hypothetical protein EYR38_003222 [Pleurotus pulmonarius]
MSRWIKTEEYSIRLRSYISAQMFRRIYPGGIPKEKLHACPQGKRHVYEMRLGEQGRPWEMGVLCYRCKCISYEASKSEPLAREDWQRYRAIYLELSGRHQAKTKVNARDSGRRALQGTKGVAATSNDALSESKKADRNGRLQTGTPKKAVEQRGDGAAAESDDPEIMITGWFHPGENNHPMLPGVTKYLGVIELD